MSTSWKDFKVGSRVQPEGNHRPSTVEEIQPSIVEARFKLRCDCGALFEEFASRLELLPDDTPVATERTGTPDTWRTSHGRTIR